MKKLNNLILFVVISLLLLSTAAYAADDHMEHQHQDDFKHEDNEHDVHTNEDEHDDHHGEEGSHDNEHEEHGADSTEITADAASAAGIVTKKAQPGQIEETISLTGRVMLNRNTTVTVRGRFPGVVKSVHVNLGESVKRGQLLAKVESNESLQVYEVKSPTDGVILERDTSAGDVAGDSALFKIADLSNVWSEFHVFPKDLGQIQEGLPVRVHTLDDNREVQASIELMLPTADRLSQTVLAIVTLDNPQGLWLPGMTVEGDVTVKEKLANVVVESSALQMLEGKQVLFVQEGQIYEARPVEIGLSSNKKVEILSGLKVGETYVSDGSFIIKADIGKESAEHSH